MSTWMIVGASRGIGHEMVKQLLARGDRVVATVRDGSRTVEDLWPGTRNHCTLLQCDTSSESSITALADTIKASSEIEKLDYVVLNAGVLHYPNRATEMSYQTFMHHLQVNTVGPIILAQKLLSIDKPIDFLVFMSSDSGSAANFNEFEDGFAAYAASKAALNQALRHMSAELVRQGSNTSVLALHPGEVATDMAKIELAWEVVGQMTAEESVRSCLKTLDCKSREDHGTFWTWDNKNYPW